MKPVSYHSIQSPPEDAEEDAVELRLPRYLRPTLLFLISLMTIGSHYGKHCLSSLGPEIMESLAVQRMGFGLMFSSEELPGIILPVVGGVALTYVPHGLAGVMLSTVLLLSTALAALAVMHTSYPLLLAGRFLFGVSDGALTTLQGTLIARWFKSKAGTGFGVMLFVTRLSTFLGLSLPAFLSHRFGLQASMWFTVLICLPPFAATVLYAVLDKRYSSYTPLSRGAQFSSRDIPGESTSPQPSSGYRTFAALLRSFPLPFWIICYLWTVVAGVVFPMLHFAPDAFSSHFGISAALSGLLSGSLVVVAALASPTMGILQDKVGRRPAILATSCSLICLGVLFCADVVSTPFLSGRLEAIAGLCLIAAGFAVAPVTLLSCIALTVDDFVTPAALGVYKATENAGLAVSHLWTGLLRDKTGYYGPSFALLAGLAASGTGAAIWLGHVGPILSSKIGESVNEDQEEP